MSKHFIEIENFSNEEVTAMFDYICTEVLKKSPIEVKTSVLGIKKVKKDTEVTLSNLLLLIDQNELGIKFRVNYLKEDKIEETPKVNPDLTIGLKVDPVQKAMADQKESVTAFKKAPTTTLDEVMQRNFEEVGAAKEKNIVASDDKAIENNGAPVFDPGALPTFQQ